MKVGDISIDIVSDGTMLLDGGSVFGQVPKTMWEVQMKPDRRNRVRMGLNCVVVQTPSANILIDSGAGSKRPDSFKDTYGLNGNKLLKGLKKLGLTSRDIDLVVLSHLHFDHVGGCTKLDRSGKAIPAFPKARHMVQKTCWEEANTPNERAQHAYHKDDFLPLLENDVLDLLDGDTDIAPGIRVKVTDGHSDGHQAVLMEIGSERIVYMADLVPTPYHVPLAHIGAFDHSPNDTLAAKRELLEMAVKGGWLMIFGHAFTQRAGYLEQRNGHTQLFPVEM